MSSRSTDKRPWKVLTGPERILRMIESPESKAMCQAIADPLNKAVARKVLGKRFQALINGIEDANLGPEALEAIELIVFAKKKIWEQIGGD